MVGATLAFGKITYVQPAVRSFFGDQAVAWGQTSPGPEPVAAFTFAKAQGSDGRTVNFTFSGTGAEPLDFKWDFDTADGDSTGTATPDSTQQNPQFTYPTDGAKTVKLVVSNAFNTVGDIATASLTVPLP